MGPHQLSSWWVCLTVYKMKSLGEIVYKGLPALYSWLGFGERLGGISSDSHTVSKPDWKLLNGSDYILFIIICLAPELKADLQ